jgi:FkbM family methyltransferase
MVSAPKTVRIYGRSVLVSGSDTDDYFRWLPDGSDITDNVLVALRRVVAEDAVCIDAGANIGLYSLGLSSLAPKGHVYAFEPSPGAMRWLDENLATNGAGNVETFGAALGDRVGTANFHDVPWFMAGGFTTEEGAYLASDAVGSTLVEVPCTTLDAFVEEAGIERVDVIKIDVEGGEMAVLEGAARTLAVHRPVVVMEFNGFAFTLHQELLPQRALTRIQEIFPYVFVIDRVDGSLSRLSTPAESYGFLYANGIHGPTDNLLCTFEQLVEVDRGSDLMEADAGGPPSRSPAAELEAVRQSAAAELEATRQAANAELEAMRRTLSWRVTAPMRAVRTTIDRHRLFERVRGVFRP